jgi:HK97 family phage prohead protease
MMAEHWIADLGGAYEARKAVWGGEAREEREESTPTKREGRMVVAKLEVRTAEGGKQIVGYGAVFNVETVIGNFFRERIMPGAFAGLLRSDVRSLYNHDPNYVLGRTSSGTLTLSEDATGLLYAVTPPQSRADVVEALERGDVTGSSFGFRVKRDEWTRPTTAAELPLRTIHEFEELLDVGPVTFPAYDETSAEARNAAAAAAAPAKVDHTDVNARERMRHTLELLDTEAL